MTKFIRTFYLLAFPATLFAGTVSLSDNTDTVSFLSNTINITNSSLTASASFSGFIIKGTFSNFLTMLANGTAPNYTLSNGTATFTFDDTPDGGTDSVSGSVSLTNATESGASNQNVTLIGTLTANSLVTGTGANTTTFLGLLSQIGITPPIPPTKTDNLLINIVNCNIGGTTTSCLPNNTAAGLDSIQAASTVGTVASVSVSSAVPEPSTMLLMGLGVAGLAFGRRVLRKA